MIAVISYLFARLHPKGQEFSLVDLRISHANLPDLISVTNLILITLIAPAVIIVAYTLLIAPFPKNPRDYISGFLWRRKLWEINAGLLGLCLSYALAFLATQIVKNAASKPRPDFLSRCQPDTGNITKYIVGSSYGTTVASNWAYVTKDICQNPDKELITDGFRAFFSGHSSQSFSGLLYLSLWLAVKFNVSFPAFQTSNTVATIRRRALSTSGSNAYPLPYVTNTAAPPIIGIIAVIVPILAACFIASTRYIEYKHDGFDVLAGCLVGAFTAWIAHRLYHSSLSNGQSWVWPSRALSSALLTRQDPEMGVLAGGTIVGYESIHGHHHSTNDAALGSKYPELHGSQRHDATAYGGDTTHLVNHSASHSNTSQHSASDRVRVQNAVQSASAQPAYTAHPAFTAQSSAFAPQQPAYSYPPPQNAVLHSNNVPQNYVHHAQY